MTMEPIQNVTAAYQGSAPSVEKTPTVTKAPEAAQASSSMKAPETKTSDQLQSADKTAVGNEASAKQADKVVTPDQASESSLKKAVDEINRQSTNTEAVWGYHEGTHRVTIKIIDKDTKEVKKEYPAEKTLDMIQKVWEMAGLMVDEKR